MSQETPANDTQTDLTVAQMLRQKREARNAIHELELPSVGLVVRLKRPSITTLMAIGKVPDALASKIMNMSGKQTTGAAVKASDLQSLLELQKIIAKESLVSPVIVDKADVNKDEIELEDLDDEDLAAIMNFVTEGVGADENAKSFRNDG